mmetsp:Transcript_50022/g.119014  ORF Transcript_50022/g.119014 Transcript_50022/m.119014 type:complete len:819 (+) Transcript_50022:109-2565(+)
MALVTLLKLPTAHQDVANVAASPLKSKLQSSWTGSRASGWVSSLVCGCAVLAKRLPRARKVAVAQRQDVESVDLLPANSGSVDADAMDVLPTRRLNTDEQERIINFAKSGEGSAIVDAKAGSGKTTTLCQCYSYTDEKMSSLCIAFNDAVVVELQQRGMPSSTAHALGWRVWREGHPEWDVAARRAESNSGSDADSSGETSRKKRAAYGLSLTDKTKKLLAEIYPCLPQDSEAASAKQRLSKKPRPSQPLERFVQKLVAMAKNHGVGVAGCMADEAATWEWLVRNYNLDRLLLDRESGETHVEVGDAIDHAREVLQASIESAQTPPSEGGLFDFDDMIYMPLREGLSFPKYDMIYVDEAQDMNLARMALLSELLHEKSRVMAVGDPFQAIFGFTGARHESLRELRIRLQAVTFPLSITWRCPVLHVELANLLLQRLRRSATADDGHDVHMKPTNNAPQGSIAGRWWPWAGLHRNKEVTFTNYPLTGRHDAAVLCRTNAPLLLLHYKLLARGIPSQLKGGKEAATELIGFAWEAINYFEHTGEATCATLEIALAKYAATAMTRGVVDARREQELDLTQCLRIMIKKVGREAPMEALESAVKSMFARRRKSKRSGSCDRSPVQLSTVHKAKGLEWQTVYILQPFALPLPHIVDPHGRPQPHVQDWERQQELNVAYVAVTRACRELLFLKHVKNIAELFGDDEAEVKPPAENVESGCVTGAPNEKRELLSADDVSGHVWQRFAVDDSEGEQVGELLACLICGCYRVGKATKRALGPCPGADHARTGLKSQRSRMMRGKHPQHSLPHRKWSLRRQPATTRKA